MSGSGQTFKLEPNVKILQKHLEALGEELTEESKKISAKKKKEIGTDLGKLLTQLEHFQLSIEDQAAKQTALLNEPELRSICQLYTDYIYRLIAQTPDRVEPQKRINNASHLAGGFAEAQVYQASVELTIALLKDLTFDQSTKDDIKLLADTVESLNTVIDHPDDESKKPLLIQKIGEVQKRGNDPKYSNADKWHKLGAALLILCMGILLAGVLTAVTISAGTVLPFVLTAVAAIISMGMGVGGVASILYGAGKREYRDIVQSKTTELHTHLTTFSKLHKEKQKSEAEQPGPTSTSTANKNK